MKKIIIGLFLFSLVLGNAFSEESNDSDNRLFKNEGYASIGTISAVGLFSGLFFSVADSIDDKLDDDEEEEHFEAYSLALGYNAFLIDVFGAGLFVNFEKFGKLDLISVQGKLSIQYGPKRFKFYHAVSGGILIIPDVAMSPIFDVTALGLKLVLDDVNIFVEGSFPSTGFLKIGASYYF